MFENDLNLQETRKNLRFFCRQFFLFRCEIENAILLAIESRLFKKTATGGNASILLPRKNIDKDRLKINNSWIRHSQKT